MSIVAVHGPNMTGGTGAGGGGTGAVVTAPNVKATADMTNGRKFTFEATDKSRPAADYDWAFGPDGTPATAADNKGPISVTFASAGQKNAVLTIPAGAGPPGAGAWPITVTALTAGPRSMAPLGSGEESEEGEYPPVPEDEELDGPEGEITQEIPIGFDPAAHTVSEVQQYADEHPDQVEEIYEAEVAGKNRSTLVNYLEALIPYDPGDYTVQEVVDYAEENPDQLDDIIEAEQAGKNRTTLVSQLEAMRP